MKTALTTTILLFANALHAQINEVGNVQIGLTGYVQLTGIISNVNTGPTLGYGAGVYVLHEVDECHHHQFMLSYERAGFTEAWYRAGQPSNYDQQFMYVKVLGERGKEIAPYLRLVYGLHLKFLTKHVAYMRSTAEPVDFNPFDFGLNLGLCYFNTEKVSVGIRYNQGFINLFQTQQLDKKLSGLNWSVAVQVHADLF